MMMAGHVTEFEPVCRGSIFYLPWKPGRWGGGFEAVAARGLKFKVVRML
jgi:hypothetical protein